MTFVNKLALQLVDCHEPKRSSPSCALAASATDVFNEAARTLWYSFTGTIKTYSNVTVMLSFYRYCMHQATTLVVQAL
jgi:hypothetical protein